MNILDRIISAKRIEVEKKKKSIQVGDLEREILFSKRTLSLKKSLLDKGKTGIIAEYKRRSPSKGVINDRDSVESVTKAYAAYGASGLSILTDYDFFGGSLDDMAAARVNDVPILRKDFIVDEFQLVESKANGADVVLLIAACLSPVEVKRLAAVAKYLGLEVLLELHEEAELDHLCNEIDIVGVNNRNLKTFDVDLERSAQLSQKIGDSWVKIAESGIRDPKDVHYLRSFGFKGFLIGEYFMNQENPGTAFREFTSLL
jgi:indole-3-glycerol phosphate synthase